MRGTPDQTPLDLTKGEPQQENSELSRLDLGDLSSWLDKYNDQFSLGRLAARALIGHSRQSEIDEELGVENSSVLSSSEHEQTISFSEVCRRNKKLLEASGLSLEPIKGQGFIIGSTLDSVDYPAEIRINLADGGKFTTYLKFLDGKKISDSQKSGLIAVAESLTKQLKTQYDLSNPEDARLLELFGNVSQIIIEYERLGRESDEMVSRAVTELKEMAAISRQGYLREYILAKHKQLLDEVGGHNFGPSKWHRDATFDFYRKKWDETLEALIEVRENPKAAALFEKCVANLINSVEYVKTDMATELNSGKGGSDIWDNKTLIFLDDVLKKLRNLQG